MKAALKSRLVSCIQRALDTAAEKYPNSEWQDDAYVHPELADHMANAVEAVFDATLASSKFTEQETAS